MQRLLDVYTVQAGDAAAAYAGRAFNLRLGRWETVSGKNMGASRFSRHVLLDADLIVATGAGAVKEGVIVRCFTVNDPTHPELATPWFDAVMSKRRSASWRGSTPLACGFFWRVIYGGLAATDVVTMGVGYE